MDKERKLIIAGNWKMNKTVAEGVALVNGIKREVKDVKEVRKLQSKFEVPARLGNASRSCAHMQTEETLLPQSSQQQR